MARIWCCTDTPITDSWKGEQLLESQFTTLRSLCSKHSNQLLFIEFRYLGLLPLFEGLQRQGESDRAGPLLRLCRMVAVLETRCATHLSDVSLAVCFLVGLGH